MVKLPASFPHEIEREFNAIFDSPVTLSVPVFPEHSADPVLLDCEMRLVSINLSLTQRLVPLCDCINDSTFHSKETQALTMGLDTGPRA